MINISNTDNNVVIAVWIHRAFRARVGNFHGPYLGPVNKHFTINTLTCAFVSVHCHRPNAQRATPSQGVAQSSQHKTGTQCGAYGWWQKHNNSKQQVGRLMADLKVIQKVIPFCKTTAATIWLWQSGQQANSSSAPHHHKVHRRPLNSAPHHHKAHKRPCHVVEGSAQLTMEDIGGDGEAQDQFSPKAMDPVKEGVLSSLSQNSGHRMIEGATSDRGDTKQTVQ